MPATGLTYKVSAYSAGLTILLAIVTGYIFKWNYTANPINFMGGDAEDYYAPLLSTFIRHDFTNQSSDAWFILKTTHGTLNVHTIGVSLLLLPFFMAAYWLASVFNYPVDGLSLPFQAAVAVAALFYATIGLVYFRKLCQLNYIGDKTTALMIPLLFFGTNLVHYSLSEAGMSHVYSFAFISVFLYLSCRYVMLREDRTLLWMALILGIVLLVRPNNIFVVLFVFIWFRSLAECRSFFKSLFTNRVFYVSLLLTATVVMLQSMVWYLQAGRFFEHTYKTDGFYWAHPQLINMLFGFNAGFFIYTPLCLLFVAGLGAVYLRNRFSFLATGAILVTLFYFFASYSSYTYFDGLGIRVLVDYYALFGLLGAKLFNALVLYKGAYGTVVLFALLLTAVNLVYCYQANRGILLRADMTYRQWKYIFLKTGAEYRDCLGGSHNLTPYARQHPGAALKQQQLLTQPFNYGGTDFGVVVVFDSIGFVSNRLLVKVQFERTESYVNSSQDAMVCLSIEDRVTRQNKLYGQYKLNETPSVDCCAKASYDYTSSVYTNCDTNDRLSVYIWNVNKAPFRVDKFAVEVFNYNYLIN